MDAKVKSFVEQASNGWQCQDFFLKMFSNLTVW
jgi:hypothetical protein